MDGWPKATDKLSNRLGKLNTQLNCLQINLQHSRLATDNLLKIIEEEDSNILCIQEPYTVGNKIVPSIPSEVFKSLVETLSRYITAIYNGCLRKGVFPKRWKKTMIVPIVKPGKEGRDDVSKFRPISLLDT